MHKDKNCDKMYQQYEIQPEVLGCEESRNQFGSDSVRCNFLVQ